MKQTLTMPLMNRFKPPVFFFSLLAVTGILLGSWIGALKAFPTPVFVPTFFQKIEAKLEAQAEVLENSVYVQETENKLASGMANMLTGWVDLIAEPERAIENGESVWKGIGKGIIDAFANTAGGLLRIVTFPLHNLKIPLPEDGVEL